MIISYDQLNDFFEDTDEEIVQKFVEPLNDVMEFYEINTPQRIAMFLAQVGHESGGLRTIKENLNYSADRLKVIFPKYFRGVDTSAFAKNP
jgi:putative chitinase